MGTDEIIDPANGYGARTVVIQARKPAPITPSSSRRKIYQVSADLENEKKLIARINTTSAFDAKKINKRLYPCDIVLSIDKRIMGFVEFKSRPGVLGYSDGVMLSLDKAAKLMTFSDMTRIPTIFVIENAPEDYHAARIDIQCGYQTRIGGRKDRGDAADMEIVILVPRANFKPLGGFLDDLRHELTVKAGNALSLPF